MNVINHSRVNYYNKTSFKGFLDPKRKEERIMNGMPPIITSEYDGYSGPKKYDFPTESNLPKESYPDVTKEFDDYLNKTFEQIKAVKSKNWLKSKKNLIKIMVDKFQTGEEWDTKYLEQFPGRDKAGRVQYALYKGTVVTANYISNSSYGQILSSLKFPLCFAKMAAKMNACGLDLILFDHKLPHKNLIKFRDPVEDQLAIISGYDGHNYGDPWKNIEIKDGKPVLKKLKVVSSFNKIKAFLKGIIK